MNLEKEQVDIYSDIYMTLPESLYPKLRAAKRVILIANNPSITTSTLDDLLAPDDMVVLFNNFVHAEYFATNETAKKLAKLIFFRQIGNSRLHFGMPPRRNKIPFIEQMCHHADVGFLFSNINYQFPTLADDPSPNDDPIDSSVQLSISEPLQAKLKDSFYSSTLADTHPVVEDYPVFESIHSSAPSSGFLMYRFMLAIRLYLQSNHLQSLEVLLVGFNPDRNTDYFWHGHNWAFERQEMENLSKGVRLIQQY